MAREKILIVDDDRELLHGLTLRLNAYEYNVLFATDAASAVATARKERPDLIILDIGLPGGDGFMVMERLRALELTAPIPIIILTAKDPSTNRERALRAGAKAFFTKPAKNEELLTAIRKAVGEPI